MDPTGGHVILLIRLQYHAHPYWIRATELCDAWNVPRDSIGNTLHHDPLFEKYQGTCSLAVQKISFDQQPLRRHDSPVSCSCCAYGV